MKHPEIQLLNQKLAELSEELERILYFGDFEAELLAAGPDYKPGRYELQLVSLLRSLRLEKTAIKRKIYVLETGNPDRTGAERARLDPS
jgi:hypothetical protein